MLLAIDVGNTNTTIGLFEGHSLKYHWFFSTDVNKTADEIGILFISLFQHINEDIRSVKDVIICSVVPPVMNSLIGAVRKYMQRNPIIVGPGTKTGINIRYENPRDVGADKIVNAVSAVRLYGAPVIVVDFGTATTFCAINGNRDYLGGVICPGIMISAEALFEKASKLPRVEIANPLGVIGRNTVASIQSGLFYGYIGQVEYIVAKIKEEMKEDNIKVVATGGLARLIASQCRCVDEINTLLTLEGLREIYYLNAR
ncbi:type III pantothenate kinase CoaX [Thermoclostridium stercorarium subsp. stercorarium DSM 8532]|uniref:Type III pantothenate kinase n=3 Tax=Thermoclostridium stercorarium TaxID=1510 RepID=L7VSA3_THES1|nr:type III pantothenate kinase [Thermoclostridium stercorarium]AGC69622.1 type III pantothenate kinase CoaX [Thermoclostridium stercorarium subsp. stercorarium DSM 8532]AGI40574.1 pantothenate kinase [Thermoclostridium stercorarium subsp. stercorarium DSM 8532]ANW99847.1 type III pantothenate kinase [Thermoclostridium stercorarium subsp. thermolacticum DSM 2910]ANX02472.1 type III pantothenate kinase [Thermoclostridium stercorarium subsp. leptospartum DSM 9219]